MDYGGCWKRWIGRAQGQAGLLVLIKQLNLSFFARSTA